MPNLSIVPKSGQIPNVRTWDAEKVRTPARRLNSLGSRLAPPKGRKEPQNPDSTRPKGFLTFVKAIASPQRDVTLANVWRTEKERGAAACALSCSNCHDATKSCPENLGVEVGLFLWVCNQTALLGTQGVVVFSEFYISWVTIHLTSMCWFRLDCDAIILASYCY